MIILLNGPPRAGKDTVAGSILRNLPSTMDYKLSTPLKKAVPVLYGLSYTAMKELEQTKDIPHPLLFDQTYRNIQIAISEKLMKPLHGEDVFGHLAVKAMIQMGARNIVVSDCGFAPEVKAITSHYGHQDVCAIQISRPGCDYTNDSRSDLDFESLGIKHVKLNNQYDLELLESQVKKILRKWELIHDVD